MSLCVNIYKNKIKVNGIYLLDDSIEYTKECVFGLSDFDWKYYPSFVAIKGNENAEYLFDYFDEEHHVISSY